MDKVVLQVRIFEKLIIECDPKITCNDKGTCLGDKCICFSSIDKGFYNPETNCLTCLSGYNGTDCKTPICKGGCQNDRKCISPDVCDCKPYFDGKNCQLKMCFEKNENDPTVCNGRGYCDEFDICMCYYPWRGRDCSSLSIVSGVSIALQVIIGLALLTVCCVLLSLLILLCKKVENPDKAEKVSWLELQNESDEE